MDAHRAHDQRARRGEAGQREQHALPLAAADQGGKSKDTATKPTAIAALGVKVAPMSQDLKDKYQLSGDQKGVVITDVSPNSPAADRGLKPGDVIVEVAQAPVETPADVQKQVDAVRKSDRKSVLMFIQSQDGVRFIPVPLAAQKDKQPG